MVPVVTYAPGTTAPARVTKVDIAFAGFWRRALAHTIDTTMLGGVYLVIFATVRLLAPDDIGAQLNVAPVCLALGWAYYGILESSPLRGTLGKAAIGLYVADTYGDPIPFWRAVLRNAMKGFSTLILFAGWALAAFTPRKQALHDLLAGTLVLRKSTYFVFGPEPPKEVGDHWDGTRWVASVPPMERS
jgi:uncharacterized RDD family membrane protein YckC